ncbi:MAG TPA: hypothetical protein VF867_03940 [Arthrobacter sp.]
MCRAGERHCKGKCTDLKYRSASQRVKKAVAKLLRILHILPPPPAPMTGDIETTYTLSELQGLIRTAIRSRPANAGELTPWEIIERSEQDAVRADLVSKYGSLDLAVVAAGAIIADRAEELQGVTTAAVHYSYHNREGAADRAHRAYLSSYEAHLAAGNPRDMGRESELEILRVAANKVTNGTDSETLNDLLDLRRGYISALSEVVPMGGTLKFHPDSDPVAVSAAQAGSACFPTSWLDLSNAERPIYAGTVQDGAYYQSGGMAAAWQQDADVFHFPAGAVAPPTEHGEWIATGETTDGGLRVFTRQKWEIAPAGSRVPRTQPHNLPQWEEWENPTTGEVVVRRPVPRDPPVYKDASSLFVSPDPHPAIAGIGEYEGVAIHEQAHRYQAVVRGITGLENLFVTRRTTLADGTRQKAESIGIDNMTAEGDIMARSDHFAFAYSGRVAYEGGATEIMSTGVEGLFGGQFGGHIGLTRFGADLEMRNFILGLMATV